MKRYIISVIIPIYNVECYLERCLESVVNQTYKNLDIVLIDDGSTDASGKICDQWSKKDKRIHVYHTINCGVSHARNEGLKHICGDFVSFIDADDWIDNDMLEKMIKTMIENHSEVGICGYKLEFENFSKINLKRDKSTIYPREKAVQLIFSYENDKIPKIISWELCDKIFDYKIVKNLKFDESIYVGEDMLFCWQILKQAKKVSYIPLYAYHYFMRPQSAMHQKVSPKSFSVLKAVRMIFQDTTDESKSIQKVIRDHYLRVGVRHSRGILKLHAYQFKEDVCFFQNYLRKNIFYALRLPYVSLKGKLGQILFCLPYGICKCIFY